ncbi:MAG: hypothetical protein HXL86_04960 [[Eubacterium] sulci]|jgi:hypothetical protein|nr:hypothetical protein [[Eubacterium] sulci]
MYKLRVTHEIELPDDIAGSPAEIVEMFNNKEFVLHDEDIAEVSAIRIEKEIQDNERL